LLIPLPELPLKQIFMLPFMMTGPLNVVPAFAALTVSLPEAGRHPIACKTACLTIIALTPAIFAGHFIMKSSTGDEGNRASPGDLA
jgi:small neutral amino acid transporter SnatA (MarC family)